MPTDVDSWVFGVAYVVEDLAFEALADSVRREILTVLAEQDECSAGELAERIQRVGRTAVSSHLRVLRVAGLISERRIGRYRYYSVNPTGSAQDVIRTLREVFQRSLDETRAPAESRGAAGSSFAAGAAHARQPASTH